MLTTNLRIAVTALSLTACVLLVGLWVRSYWWRDLYSVKFYESHELGFDSFPGALILFHTTEPGVRNWSGPQHMDKRTSCRYLSDMFSFAIPGFGIKGDGTFIVGLVPYWFPALVSAAVAIVPWIHWSKRFSLRTLLIGTTLVAVGLGLIVVSR